MYTFAIGCGRWKEKGLQKTKLSWHVLRKTKKTVVSVDKKGVLKVKLILWIWKIHRHKTNTKTHKRKLHKRALPTHKSIHLWAQCIKCMVKQYVCRKMVEYCGKVGSGRRENTSFTIYYWWPHEKRHLSPEKPLKTSSLYTNSSTRQRERERKA